MRGRTLYLGAVLVGALAGGCQRPGANPGAAAADAGVGADALRRTTQAGPVKATVALSPQKPRLGDPLVLELTVEAEPQVTVELPPFGEALGRFVITSFTPREERLASGGTRSVQRYVLEAPMSGVQRIPPLRLEFRDLRPGAAPPDGGVADEPRELLTDELSIDVQSVLPGAEDDALAPLREALPERMSPGRAGAALGIGALGLLGVALFVYRGLSRRQRQQLRVNAYAAALERLAALEARGAPTGDAVDPWYVGLSDVVRRYVEDRYGVRAPELTTEEFLREAQRLLAPRLREGLGELLAVCDRVKFAGYQPGADESREALRLARRFLDETRPADEGAARGRAVASPEARP